MPAVRGALCPQAEGGPALSASPSGRAGKGLHRPWEVGLHRGLPLRAARHGHPHGLALLWPKGRPSTGAGPPPLCRAAPPGPASPHRILLVTRQFLAEKLLLVMVPGQSRAGAIRRMSSSRKSDVRGPGGGEGDRPLAPPSSQPLQGPRATTGRALTDPRPISTGVTTETKGCLCPPAGGGTSPGTASQQDGRWTEAPGRFIQASVIGAAGPWAAMRASCRRTELCSLEMTCRGQGRPPADCHTPPPARGVVGGGRG